EQFIFTGLEAHIASSVVGNLVKGDVGAIVAIELTSRETANRGGSSWRRHHGNGDILDVPVEDLRKADESTMTRRAHRRGCPADLLPILCKAGGRDHACTQPEEGNSPSQSHD